MFGFLARFALFCATMCTAAFLALRWGWRWVKPRFFLTRPFMSSIERREYGFRQRERQLRLARREAAFDVRMDKRVQELEAKEHALDEAILPGDLVQALEDDARKTHTLQSQLQKLRTEKRTMS